jgi:hypothetical protein
MQSKMLADWVRNDLRARLACFDADGTVGGLLASMGSRDEDGKLLPEQDPLVGCGFFDIRTSVERNQTLDCVSCGADLILLDLAGGSCGDLQEVVDGGAGVSGLLEGYRQYGYTVVLMHMLSNLLPAATSVGQYLSLFGSDALHVAVRNLHFGRSDGDFPFWTGFAEPGGRQVGGKYRKQLLESGGIIVDLPALQPPTYAKVEALGIPYSRAVTDERLSITERMQVQKFRRDFAANMAPLAKLLDLTP